MLSVTIEVYRPAGRPRYANRGRRPRRRRPAVSAALLVSLLLALGKHTEQRLHPSVLSTKLGGVALTSSECSSREVALLVAVSAATAGRPLHGRSRRVRTPRTISRRRLADRSLERRYTSTNGVVLIRGRGTETTTTISFGHETGPAACTGALGAATYRWSLRAGLLRLTTVREGCLGRHVVLTTHPLKKVG
jgi:hypothetical protein